MLKDYEFDDDDYKPDELQNDVLLIDFYDEPNYSIGKRVSPDAF